MSSEEVVANAMYPWFISFLPAGFFTFIFYYSVKLQEHTHTLWNQLCFSSKLFWNSFKAQYIHFYRIGDVFVPYHTFVNTIPYIIPGNEEWTYDCANKLFLEQPNGMNYKVKKIPFLGTILMNKERNEMTADLTEWLMDVHTSSRDAVVPPQVLVTAFLSDTNTSIHGSLDNYYLHCTTLTLDDIDFELSTGKERIVQENDTGQNT